MRLRRSVPCQRQRRIRNDFHGGKWWRFRPRSMIGQCRPRRGPQRCRHQQRLAADCQVVAEQRAQQLGHIRVAGMRLIDYKQTARDSTSSQVSPFHFERGKQDLIDRAYRGRRAQEMAGTLRGPARATSRLILWIILPFDLEPPDPAGCGEAGLGIAWDGEHGLNPYVRWEQSAQRHVHSTLQLLCRRAGRNREVESVDKSCTPEGIESQHGSFGLPRSGLAFQHQQ